MNTCAEFTKYDNGFRSSRNNEVYTDFEMIAIKSGNHTILM